MINVAVLLAVRSLRRHTGRSLLTVVGIVIGIASVVTMVTLAKSTAKVVQGQIANLGTNLLHLHPGQAARRGGGGPPPPDFQPSDVSMIARQVTGVTGVAPQAQTQVNATYRGQNVQTTVFGMGLSYFEVQPWPLAEGRLFTPEEDHSGKLVCIIGWTVKKGLFPVGSPLGRIIRIGSLPCKIVGVLISKGFAQYGDQDDQIIMPIKLVARRLIGTTDIKAILVGVDPAFDVEQIKSSIRLLLRERRHLSDNRDDDFTILDTREISSSLQKVTNMLTKVIAALAAISLIVGGIGVMNVMLVTVNERTKEIGVRLAIGALRREILLQFIFEASGLTLVGGLIGLVLAQASVLSLSKLLGIPWSFDPMINVLSVMLAAFIGIVSGFAPALQAARLNPVDAIKYG